ncbi:JM113 [macacine gammaherpesvirus 11]|uniref:JM113 n=2 Tax=macacine gammaherpesvirus 11 TaxID=2560570 RepID=G9JMU1_9GAMA|nr:JM113 [Macaca fuscata rhadinovirus]AAT00090.1 JM113 [Macaca fuscata rhadinovirus]AEW87638.1 JM113 [Macaca fuscata rhadinovirus]AEW87808.1 JM113 [Macaca fuscata rhadinovirus]
MAMSWGYMWITEQGTLFPAPGTTQRETTHSVLCDPVPNFRFFMLWVYCANSPFPPFPATRFPSTQSLFTLGVALAPVKDPRSLSFW